MNDEQLREELIRFAAWAIRYVRADHAAIVDEYLDIVRSAASPTRVREC